MGTIGALHMFIFRQRAAEYQGAKAAYQATMGTFASQGTAPRLEDIDRFKYESIRYKLKFWQNIATLRLGFPDYVVNDSNVFTPARQKQIYWDFLAEIEKRRDAGERGEGPVLRFMGPGDNSLANARPPLTSWNITKGLPDKYKTVAVDDDLAKLRDENRLLKNLNVGTSAYQTREAQYLGLMNALGVNVYQRDGQQILSQTGGTISDGTGIVDRFGRAAATVMTINRIDLILKKLQPDFFAGKNESEIREEM